MRSLAISHHEGKSKKVAGLLAVFLGLWGAHRFYLGKKFLGIVNFVAFFISLLIVVNAGIPWFLVALAMFISHRRHPVFCHAAIRI